MKFNTRTKLAAQRVLAMEESNISIRVVVGRMNVTEEMKNYILSKGYVALYPNGVNFSVTGL